MLNSDEQASRTNSVAAAINELGAAAQEIAHAVLRTRPGAAKSVSRVSGAIMILIAVVLLAEQAYS